MERVIGNHVSWTGRLTRVGPLLAVAILLPWAWLQRVKRRRELMGLLSQPDYIIKDVGLDRSQITGEGVKPFWMA